MSNNAMMYPGRGKELRPVQSVTGNQYLDPNYSVVSIPTANKYSEVFAAHDCLEVMLEFVFTSAAATGNVTIERLADASAAAVGETFTVLSVTASKASGYRFGGAYNGYFRCVNNSGQPMIVYIQKRML